MTLRDWICFLAGFGVGGILAGCFAWLLLIFAIGRAIAG